MFGEIQMIDDEEEYEESGKGNRFLGFMFGNVDNSGDLDVDYLDEVTLCSIYCYFWIWLSTCLENQDWADACMYGMFRLLCFFFFFTVCHRLIVLLLHAIQFWRILVFRVQTAKTDWLFATFVFGRMVETIRSDFAFCKHHFSENTNVWLLLD